MAEAKAGWRDGRRTRWRNGVAETGVRALAEEVAVAIVYDAATYAVMMASPSDLEDFALGISLTEGVVASASEIEAVEIVETELGLEARVWLKPASRQALASRRRRLAGPTGCGLCGVDSLAEAVRAPPKVGGRLRLAPADIAVALDACAAAQALGAQTRAVHAAGFWTPEHGLVALREDVGRHNALDKLAGALTQDEVRGAEGVVVLTSRVSVEMVQKTAVIGSTILIAVSAPTTLAVRTAEEAGITLVAVARQDGFEAFSHPERIAW